MEGFIFVLIIMGIGLMFGGKSVDNSSSANFHDKSPEDKSGDDEGLGSSLYTYRPSRTPDLQIPQFRLYEQTDQQAEVEKARLEKWWQKQGDQALKDVMRRLHPYQNRSYDDCSCKEWRDRERESRMRELDSRARNIEMDLMRIRIKSNPFLRGK
ncbi:MAG: hypothetical protein WCV69_02830 [Patescibacteria group bacterium]|jgi:hypothetical protein